MKANDLRWPWVPPEASVCLPGDQGWGGSQYSVRGQAQCGHGSAARDPRPLGVWVVLCVVECPAHAKSQKAEHGVDRQPTATGPPEGNWCLRGGREAPRHPPMLNYNLVEFMPL